MRNWPSCDFFFASVFFDTLNLVSSTADSNDASPFCALTNKDRLCERSEPRSYPVVGRARYVEGSLNISKYLFLNVKRWKVGLDEHFLQGERDPSLAKKLTKK